jgi:hypothetical protein
LSPCLSAYTHLFQKCSTENKIVEPLMSHCNLG